MIEIVLSQREYNIVLAALKSYKIDLDLLISLNHAEELTKTAIENKRIATDLLETLERY